MYSSFCHMVFTWMEMFSHVFSRYLGLGFSGSVLHVENSLTALLIWPLQLNHMWQTEQSFLSSSSPMEAAPMATLSSSWSATKEDAWKPKWKSVFGKRQGDRERHEGKKESVVFSSNTCWDNSLKWKETRKTEQGLRRAPTVVVTLHFK